jgi:hypothetical protein
MKRFTLKRQVTLGVTAAALVLSSQSDLWSCATCTVPS